MLRHEAWGWGRGLHIKIGRRWGWTYLFATLFRAPAAENALATHHEPAVAGIGHLIVGVGGGRNLLVHGVYLP